MIKANLISMLKSYPFQRSFKTAFILFVAVFVTHYFSFSKEFWLILAAFFATHTTPGTQLKQAIIYFFLLTFAVLVAFFLTKYIKISFFNEAIVVVFFIICSYVSFTSRFINENIFMLLSFALFLLIATFSPALKSDVIYNRVSDIFIGMVLGTLLSRIIFPFKATKEFKKSIIFILQVMIQYLHTLKKQFFNHNEYEAHENSEFLKAKMTLRNALEPRHGFYPEWVHEMGFNPRLRAGFRFFLVKLERISEILFSIEYFISCSLDKNLLKEIKQNLSVAVDRNCELMEIIIAYAKDESAAQKANLVQSDFTSDIVTLNDTLKQIVPSKVELLDLSNDYIILTSVVRNIKDMRELLLQLALAFPTSEQ